MSEMVERVARAMAGHFGPNWDDLPKGRVELREVRRHSMVYSDNTQDDLLEAARAAIGAMLESTDAMNVAGGNVTDWEDDGHGGEYERDVGEYTASRVWRAMAEAALKDSQ